MNGCVCVCGKREVGEGSDVDVLSTRRHGLMKVVGGTSYRCDQCMGNKWNNGMLCMASAGAGVLTHRVFEYLRRGYRASVRCGSREVKSRVNTSIFSMCLGSIPPSASCRVVSIHQLASLIFLFHHYSGHPHRHHQYLDQSSGPALVLRLIEVPLPAGSVSLYVSGGRGRTPFVVLFLFLLQSSDVFRLVARVTVGGRS
jgi:hypothetical protein